MTLDVTRPKTAETDPNAGPAPTTRRRRSATTPRWWHFALVVAPALAIFGTFAVYPIGQVLWHSFTNFDGFTGVSEYVGLENYVRIFTGQDADIASAVGNTAIYAFFYIIVQLMIALFIAVLLVQKMRGSNFYRTAFFVPTVISPVAVAFTWAFMFDPGDGTVNSVLRAVGLESLTQDWLGDYDLALYSVIAVDLWRHIGFSVVIFIAGLSTVREETIEAARIDGANAWQTLLHVTFPQIKPTIALAGVLAVNGALRAFDTVYLMTGGGPGQQTQLYMTLAFQKAFVNNQFGYASAMSVVVIVALIPIAVLQNRLNNPDRLPRRGRVRR